MRFLKILGLFLITTGCAEPNSNIEQNPETKLDSNSVSNSNVSSSPDKLFNFEKVAIDRYSTDIHFTYQNPADFYIIRDSEYFLYETNKKVLSKKEYPCQVSDVSDFLWSPDSKTMVISNYEKLFVCYADKSELVELASTGRGYSYTWKNSEEFIFNGEIKDDLKSGIYIYNVQTRVMKMLLNDKHCRFCSVTAFLPAEKKLFYFNMPHEDEIALLSVEIINNEAKNIETIIHEKNIWIDSTFSVTEDGKFSVFTGQYLTEEGDKKEMFFVDIENKRLKRLSSTETASDNFASLSPDGGLIVLMSSDGGGTKLQYSHIDLNRIFQE